MSNQEFDFKKLLKSIEGLNDKLGQLPNDPEEKEEDSRLAILTGHAETFLQSGDTTPMQHFLEETFRLAPSKTYTLTGEAQTLFIQARDYFQKQYMDMEIQGKSYPYRFFSDSTILLINGITDVTTGWIPRLIISPNTRGDMTQFAMTHIKQ